MALLPGSLQGSYAFSGKLAATSRLGAGLALALLLGLAQLSETFAQDTRVASTVQELVPFSSDEGLARLARSNAKVDFPALATRLSQNAVQEKLTAQWIDHCLNEDSQTIA